MDLNFLHLYTIYYLYTKYLLLNEIKYNFSEADVEVLLTPVYEKKTNEQDAMLRARYDFMCQNLIRLSEVELEFQFN